MTSDDITGEHIFTLKDIGLDIAVIGFLISLAGVIANNLVLAHTTAMLIWCPSNAIFMIYFFGRARDYWDGHIGDGLMCLNYAFMLVSGMGIETGGGVVMCDKKSIRELREESALKELWHKANEIVEPPLTAEELIQKKKQKDGERKEMEFIERYMR